MLILYAAVCAFILDLLFGDPAWIPHPVVFMGKAIAWFERTMRPRFSPSAEGQFLCGVLLAVCLPLLTLAVTGGLCALCYYIHPAVFFVLETFWGWQSLAVKGLADEGRNVYRKLTARDIPAARKAVGRIVGRDTAHLDESGIIRAAVESIAENDSDGAAAPMLYFFLGGAPLSMVYKAINTMDSCVGYRNERYIYFGRAAAKLDDAANYIPSRIAALFLIFAAAATGQDMRNAYRIWRRDRRSHDSPNSAQTESVCAGALGIRLGGTAWYFGKRYDKPTIGDAGREPEPEDILRANRMLYAANILLLTACALLRLLFIAAADWL